MRFLVLLISLFLSIPADASEWTAGPAPGDDPKSRVAWVKNDEGHVLILRGESEGDRYWVFAEFRLGNGKALGGEIPSHMFRVGYEIENDWQLGYVRWGRDWGTIGTTTASWMLSSFARDEYAAGEVDVLKAWFEKSEVAIVYRTDGGTMETTHFPLAGSKAALVAATGWTIGD